MRSVRGMSSAFVNLHSRRIGERVRRWTVAIREEHRLALKTDDHHFCGLYKGGDCLAFLQA
jgi:hypothetical protein